MIDDLFCLFCLFSFLCCVRKVKRLKIVFFVKVLVSVTASVDYCYDKYNNKVYCYSPFNQYCEQYTLTGEVSCQVICIPSTYYKCCSYTGCYFPPVKTTTWKPFQVATVMHILQANKRIIIAILFRSLTRLPIQLIRLEIAIMHMKTINRQE